MRSSDIVLMARQRAGLTQQQLAERAHHPRESIARWEAGVREPSLTTLTGLVAACDLDLAMRLMPQDPSLRDVTADQLALNPVDRLKRLLPAAFRTDCLRALRWVADSRTSAIVVGAVAGVLQGEPQRPGDGHVEIVSEDPLLTEHEMRGSNLTPVDADERWATNERREPWAIPSGGTITLVRDPPGAQGYRDLRRNATRVNLARGRGVSVAHVRDLLRMADASSRDSETLRAPALRVLLALLVEEHRR